MPSLADVALAAGEAALAVDVQTILKDGLPAVDEGSMSVGFIFASETCRDRVGDVVRMAGIVTDAHRLNPVGFIDHGKHVHEPIGVTETRHDKRYTVVIDMEIGYAAARTYFSQKTLSAEQYFALCVEGIMGRAGSIGYRTLAMKKIPADPQNGFFKPGLDLLSVELLEPSIVGIPTNQDCARKALAMPAVCGKSLSPDLRRMIEPYAPQRKHWENGWRVPVQHKSLLSNPRTLSENLPMPATKSPPPKKGKAADAASPAMSAIDSSAGSTLTNEPESTPKVPHGAQVRANLHGAMMMLHDVLDSIEGEDMGALEPEDRDTMAGHLEKIRGAATDLAGPLAEEFSSRYPDLEPLKGYGDEEETEEPKEETKDEEKDPDKENANATRKPEEEEAGGPDEKSYKPWVQELRTKGAKRLPRRFANGKAKPATTKDVTPDDIAAKVADAVKKHLVIGKKSMGSAHTPICKAAADYLDEHADEDNLNHKQRAAVKYHARELRGQCKDDEPETVVEGATEEGDDKARDSAGGGWNNESEHRAAAARMSEDDDWEKSAEVLLKGFQNLNTRADKLAKHIPA